MAMPTDAERREVARRLRVIRPCKSGHIEWWTIAKALDLKESAGWFGWEKFEPDSVNRLADLIEPTGGFDLDTVQRVCFECMEGCDEPEWTLYTTVYDAIARYKRGESGPTCDLDKLLALADELDKDADNIISAARNAQFTGGRPRMGDAKHDAYEWRSIARRIREALGV